MIVLLLTMFSMNSIGVDAQTAAQQIVNADRAADFNGDGAVNGLDVQAATDEMIDPHIGVYRASELARAKLHAQAPALLADREDWIRRNAASYAANESTPFLELMRCLGACAEYEFLARPDAPFLATAHAAELECARRIAQVWPGGLDRHNRIYRLIDLARVASIAPDTLEIFSPRFREALSELKSGALYGTNVGMGLWARAWLHAALGERVTPLNDYDMDWGLNRILDVGVDADNGLFTFDGNDLWYWFFNSRGAVIAIGEPLHNQLTPDRRKKLDAVYTMPIRTLCVGGAHPFLGAAKAAPKSYRFFGGFLRDWSGNDEASRWARMTIRARGDTLRFDDLIVPDDAGYSIPFADHGRPPQGRGSRDFTGRLAIIEDGSGESRVLHIGFGRQINGGHQRISDYPAMQIINGDVVRFPLTQEVRMFP